MRKILSLAAAVASVFAMGAVQADVIYIDTFDLPNPAQSVSVNFTGTAANGTAASITTNFTTPTPNPTPLIASERTATITAVSQTQSGASTMTVGQDAFFASATNFIVSNPSGLDSDAKIDWTIGSNAFAYTAGMPISLFFDVISVDISVQASSILLTAGPTTYTLLTNQLLVVGRNTFALDAAAASALANQGGTLTLNFAGAQDYDITLDTLGVEIPEPTSLALVGLALVGAGVASRRRKA